MAEETGEAFDRGHAAGQIAARLAGHDRHFEAINGSLADVAREMRTMNLLLQRLGDQAVARDATVVTTAAALKDAEEARRGKAESSWSPWAKAFAVVAALATLVGLVLVLVPR